MELARPSRVCLFEKLPCSQCLLSGRVMVEPVGRPKQRHWTQDQQPRRREEFLLHVLKNADCLDVDALVTDTGE